MFSVLAATAAAMPTVHVAFEDGVPLDTSGPLTGTLTTADLMGGIVVTVEFADGSVEAAPWMATGSGEGQAAGVGWSLAASGDTFDAVWTLANAGGVAIRSIDIDGPPAAVLFDTTFASLFGTPGSGAGRTFEAVSGPAELDVEATYCDVVGVLGEAPVGDLFGRLHLLFANKAMLAPGQSLGFRADTDALTAGSEVFPATNYLWDNGPADGITGFVSTINDHTQSVVADDCWLKEGMFYSLDAAYVRMAISDGAEPQTELWFFADCDGEPDGVTPMFVVPQASFEVVDASPADPLLGTVIYEIRYELDRFIAGEDIRWVSAVHTGEGMGFWVSANNGKVQGKQAHANAAGFALPAWTPADQDICCGICTDVFFRIEGKCCWRVLAQSNFDLDGLSSPVLAQNAPWNRSFDDFQLADPCKQVEEWGICRIEAIFATNCDLSTIYAEIFDNACDTVADPLAARARLEPTSVELIGSPLPSGSGTLSIYRVFFDCPPDLLPTGRNYWFSIFSEQGFVAGKRSVWLFQERTACNIRLNEALYYTPPIGFVEPTPVSDAGLAGSPRGHAFSVWVCEP